MTISIAEREAATSAELHNLQELMSKSVNDPFSDFNRLKHQSLLLKLSLYQTILAQPQSKSLSQELYALVDLYERRLDVMLIGANDSSQYMQGMLERLGASACKDAGHLPLVKNALAHKQAWLAAQTDKTYLEIMQALDINVAVKIIQNQRRLVHFDSILKYANIFVMESKVKIVLHLPTNIADEKFTHFSGLLDLTDYMSWQDADSLANAFGSTVLNDKPSTPDTPAWRRKCVIM